VRLDSDPRTIARSTCSVDVLDVLDVLDGSINQLDSSTNQA
jgi:hypothetical protein